MDLNSVLKYVNVLIINDEVTKRLQISENKGKILFAVYIHDVNCIRKLQTNTNKLTFIDQWVKIFLLFSVELDMNNLTYPNSGSVLNLYITYK